MNRRGTGPLAGVRVIELAGLGPAPFAAMMLADMGAEVVGVARPGPAPQGPAIMNTGERSIVLDPARPGGTSALLELAGRADILIEGFRPGLLERLGVDPRDCRARNPGLVHGRMTSGLGQVVDAAIVDGAAALMTPLYGLLAQRTWVDERESTLLDGGRPWYRAHRTGDDRWLAVGALEPRFWSEPLSKLGIPRPRTARHDPSTWPARTGRIAQVVASRTRDHWEHVFEGSDACVGPAGHRHRATPRGRHRDAALNDAPARGVRPATDDPETDRIARRRDLGDRRKKGYAFCALCHRRFLRTSTGILRDHPGTGQRPGECAGSGLSEETARLLSIGVAIRGDPR